MKVCFYLWGCIGLFVTAINMALLAGVSTNGIMQQMYVAVFFLLSFIAGLLFFGLGMIGTRNPGPQVAAALPSPNAPTHFWPQLTKDADARVTLEQARAQWSHKQS
jgi:hypothetical protein